MSARAVIAVRIARALRGTFAASISTTTTTTGTTGGAGCGSETD